MYPKSLLFKFFCIALPGMLCVAFNCLNKAMAQNITVRMIDLPRSLNKNILSVNKDDDGFLWFTNSQGIWRFDGTDAILFNKAKLKLKPNAVIQILYCFDHFLLALDGDHQLHAYDELNDTGYVFKLSAGQIYNFTEAKKQLLFFTSLGRGYVFSRHQLLQTGQDLSKLKGWKKGMVLAACAVDTTNNRIYLYLDRWIGYVKSDSVVAENWFDGKNLPYANRFFTNSGLDITTKYLVINHNNGFVLYDKNTLRMLHLYEGRDIAGRVVADDKIVFLAKTDSLALQPAMHSPFFSVEAPIFKGGFNIYGVVPAEAAGRFIGAGELGLFELRFHKLTTDTFYKKDLLVRSFSNKSIRGILRLNNQLYVGTYNGVYRYNGRSVQQISPQLAYSMAAIDDNTLLWGVENFVGMAVYNPATDKTELPFYGDSVNAIRCLCKYNGQYWGGADNGLYQFYKKAGAWGNHRWLYNKALGAVRQIMHKNGNWYLATQNGFFSISDQKAITKIYPLNDDEIVYAFVEAGDGFILATHGNGIAWIDKNGQIQSKYGLKEGLPGEFVYSLVKEDSLLVAGTSVGPAVFVISGHVLKPVPLGADEENGIFEQECNHGAFFNDTISHQIILGGLQGLMFIDKDYYTAHANDMPGKVLLSYIKLVGDISKPPTTNIFAYNSSEIVVPPNQSYIGLKFASPLNFNHSAGLMRIKGISDNWQSFNLNDEVNLVALPPGTYVIEARLGESQDEKYWFTKTLVVRPTFYQTVLFKIIIMLAVLLVFVYIVYLFWRARVKKLEAEQQLRTTIASDLHDDIGSTLNSISVYTEILSRQLQNADDKAKALMDKMGMASRGMIDTMSDIVWTINPKNDDFENVLKRMQFFAGELLSGKNIRLEFDVDEKVKKLKFTMPERKNIYLIYKEAINNIFKYSEATKATVSIIKEGHSLTLTINDNGKGFNTTEKSNSGNGLGNIKNRAKEIGASLSINSTPGNGTNVLLQLPLA